MQDLQIKGDGTTRWCFTISLIVAKIHMELKLESPAHSAGQSYTLKFPTGNVTAGKY